MSSLRLCGYFWLMECEPESCVILEEVHKFLIGHARSSLVISPWKLRRVMSRMQATKDGRKLNP